MDAWAYAVVDNSQKPGTGNGGQATGNLGTPVAVSQGGTRSYNRPACAVFVSQGGQRSYECGVWSAESKARSQTPAPEPVRTRGRNGCPFSRRTCPPRAAGIGQRPGTGNPPEAGRQGNRKPAREARRAGKGTGNPPEKPGGQARGDTRALSAPPRLISLCAAKSYGI
jgi:hypothetical protein